jgi:glycosyltransferase involved in cell wall biosynthesis
MGLAFHDVGLVVKLQQPRQRIRELNRTWVEGPLDLEVDYGERYAYEWADVAICTEPRLLDQGRQIGWPLRPDVIAVPEATPFVDRDDRIAAVYRELVRSRRIAAVSGAPTDSTLVTVAIPYYNLGRYLPEALESLAGQTYPAFEVIVIDDGSTDANSIDVFRQMQDHHPRYRFHRQANAGIGATRNRGLREARGTYFLPMDADNVARPDMIERLVAGLQRNPHLSAVACYYLAFRETADLRSENYAYAYRPTGGPHVLGSLKNVYGDGNALFRTDHFRAVGGYETDRDTSWEDWEAFVKLVNSGYRVDVVPDHLFYYRHLESGFSRATNSYANHQRVLRQFFRVDRLPTAERVALWTALASFRQQLDTLKQENEVLRDRLGSWRHRLTDRLHDLCNCAPFVLRALKGLFRSTGLACGTVCRGLQQALRSFLGLI